jgi:hypothetical protein
MSEIGALSVRIGADTADLTKGLNQAKDGIKSFENASGRLSNTLKGLFAVISVGAIASFTKEVIDAGDALGDLSERTGISVDQLSRLQYAAQISDVSLGELQGSLNSLTKNMSAASMGTGEADRAFKLLGISYKTANGDLRNSNDVLLDLADSFSKLEDGPNKNALALAIFNKSATTMIPLLNQGRDGITGLGAEFDRLGGTVTPEAAKAFGTFNDNLDKIQVAIRGVALAFANSIMPSLVEFTTRISAAIQSNLSFYRSLQLIFTTEDQKRIEDLNKKLDELAKANISRSIVGRKARQEEIEQIKLEIAERQKLLAEKMKEPDVNARRQAPVLRNTEDEAKKQSELLDKQQQDALKVLQEEQKIEDDRIKMIDDRLLAVQKSLLTERELVMLSNEERLVALNEARLNERLSEEAFAQAKIDLEQQTQDRLNEIRKRGLNDLEKFTHSSYSKQVKTIVGMMEQMTAGSANQSKAMFNINKAAALANAVMKGYESIQNAYAFGSRFAGPAGGAAMAAIAAVATGAQIRGIASQQFNGGGTVAPSVAASTPAGAVPVADVGGGGGGGGAGQVVTINLTGEIFGREQVRGLIGQINEAISDGAVLRLQ